MFDRFNAWVGSLYMRSHGLKKEDGQTFVEYALVLVLIAVAVVALTAFTGLVTAIGNAIQSVTDAITPGP